MTRQEIDKMKSIDIREVDPAELVDIAEVKIDETVPRWERVQEFVKQVKNPYCFKCNGTVVKLDFSPSGLTFQEGMIEYLVQKLGSTDL